MGMTMIEKILARAAGRAQVQAGDTVVCQVDMNILIDLQFTCWVEPLKIADPRRVAIILDHAVPAPTVADADAGVRARAFARTFGIERFFDIGTPRHLPPGHRGERARAARSGADLHRFAHLRARGRTTMRLAVSGLPR
jgi:homoaconitase/3-isopropylmalate dehydratase large subunit